MSGPRCRALWGPSEDHPSHESTRRSGRSRPASPPTRGRRRQRLQHPGRHRQRLRQPDRQHWCSCGRSSRWASRSAGKNLFPSNIAGLPTWYTIRANKDGYIGRKKEIDFLVAMNPETAREDVLSLEPGALVRLRRAAAAQGAAHRHHVLPGPVRQARRRRHDRRQAAPPRAQHDLRRRPLVPARHRAGRDQEGPRQAAREEAEGDGAEQRRARQGLRLRRGDLRQGRRSRSSG